MKSLTLLAAIFGVERGRFAMTTQAVAIRRIKPAALSGFHVAFVVAWLFCLLFYFMEYAVRSAPSVMLPELQTTFGRTTVGTTKLMNLPRQAA
jgi:hypothetical protein